MDYCGLSEELLEEAERILTYDPNIPFQFRVMSCVLYDNDYVTARALLEANKGEFDGEYGYLVLDFAVEMCINITVDHIVDGRCVKRPAPETIEFIKYLLDDGADPNLPKQFNQLEHIYDVEEDGSHQCGCEFDCSEVRELLKRYM